MESRCHYFLNPADRPKLQLDRKFNKLFKNSDTLGYHRKLRKYSPAPVVSLSKLAKSLGIKELYVKNESRRFNLNNFKSLGASWAVHQFLLNNKGKFTFCTATDGNHGKSVAWAARLNKQKSVIFVPGFTVQSRIKGIKKYGGEVVVVDGDYDQAAQRARTEAEKNNYILIQDSAWEGYTKIPADITCGYKTMLEEMEDGINLPRNPGIDFVFLQSGVGTWASSVVTYYRIRYPRKMPKMVVIEPNESDSLIESMKQGKLSVSKASGNTIMAGLNCGTPSTLAWDILKDGVDLFLSIPDEYTIKAMQNLYYPFKGDKQIFAGESGAAGLAGLIALMCDPGLEELRKNIGLGADSRVLVFNTEGVTDPEIFDELIQKEIEDF